ncbi:MAG: Small-conductance mechanosensitive channel MscMJ [Candidatus Argoarchaeum ethanivorans]|uniref:Small-conductance mechanosensitive channel MscMJ n=1 Tax=Candidatus Argoarchaeum ethanivorans TaxID=2608793 RepID=A0A811TEX0_9EURY|nr:MAG: Small-conductance mechanosensitive channel MscMJ [Candidatus Argoarchaeum ethanivorans]
MLGSSFDRIIILFLIIFFTLVIRKLTIYIFEEKLIHITRKTKTELDDLLVKALKDPIGYAIIGLGLAASIHSLPLPENIGTIEVSIIINSIFTLLFTLIALFVIFRLIDVLAYYMYKAASSTETKLDEQLTPLIIKTLKIVVFILSLLFILQNIGWNITSLLAGLGIGGLAFALAAQETISNLFGSFTIFSDRCFHIGDWVRIGDVEGTVEEVGFRSTRIRRFDQALVTMPNSRFIKSEVINFSEMKKRRIKFNLGVSYKTTAKQMTDAVEGIKKIIEDDARFERSFYMVHFTEFGAYSLDIFIYCFTKTTIWNEYLSMREEFNLKIMKLLEELNVEIAYPTQTIQLS